MFITRIRQFLVAIKSKVYVKDILFINQYLSHSEKKLFFQMDIPTQRHCLNVAYSCLQLINPDSNIDNENLIKAALLHDCGKQKGDINSIQKAIIVIISKFFPNIFSFLSKKGAKNSTFPLAHAFYIQSIHAQRGAALAQNDGLSKAAVYLIQEHHNKHSDLKSKALLILQKTDNSN